jgi:hypothetical protein
MPTISSCCLDLDVVYCCGAGCSCPGRGSVTPGGGCVPIGGDHAPYCSRATRSP